GDLPSRNRVESAAPLPGTLSYWSRQPAQPIPIGLTREYQPVRVAAQMLAWTSTISTHRLYAEKRIPRNRISNGRLVRRRVMSANDRGFQYAASSPVPRTVDVLAQRVNMIYDPG